MTRRFVPTSQCARAALGASFLLLACSPAEPVEVEARPPPATIACEITYKFLRDDGKDGPKVSAVGSFDAAANLVGWVETVDSIITRSLRYTYDADGRRTSVTEVGAAGRPSKGMSIEYDTYGHATAIGLDLEADGTVDASLAFRYVDGRLTRIEYDSDSDGPDAPVLRQTRTYDGAGVETGVESFGDVRDSLVDGLELSRAGIETGDEMPGDTTYASTSRCTEAEGACGPGEPRVVTRAGDVHYPDTDSRSEYRYRADGKVEFESHDLDGDGLYVETTQYTYDADGVLTGHEREPGPPIVAREVGTVEVHDADGRPLRTRVVRGSSTTIRTQTYNERGDEVDLTESTEAGDETLRTTRAYDAEGRLTQVRSFRNGEADPFRERLWTYDARGRQATYEDRGTGTRRAGDEYLARATEWRADGLAIKWNLDRDGDGATDQVVEVTHDAHGAEIATRTTGRGDPGPDLEWQETLDAADRVLESTSRTLPQGEFLSAESATFDDAGHVIETRSESAGGFAFTEVHEYDDRGYLTVERTNLRYPGVLDSGASFVATTACVPTRQP